MMKRYVCLTLINKTDVFNAMIRQINFAKKTDYLLSGYLEDNAFGVRKTRVWPSQWEIRLGTLGTNCMLYQVFAPLCLL